MREINGRIFVTEDEVQSCFDFDVRKAIKTNWKMSRFYFVKGISPIVLFMSAKDPASRYCAFKDPCHMFEGMISFTTPFIEKNPDDGSVVQTWDVFVPTGHFSVDGKFEELDEIFDLDILPIENEQLSDDYRVAFATRDDFLDIAEHEVNHYGDRMYLKIYFDSVAMTKMLQSFGVMTGDVSVLIRSLLYPDVSDMDEEPQEAQDVFRVEFSEPPPNSRKNYNRVIRALADMAGLDILEPYKAAEVLLTHAVSKGLPIPSKSATWGDRLKAAKDTD